MCDHTKVSYLPGDVVWTKLGAIWWPAAVCKTEDVPAEIIHDLRKVPIAIVKFFQEDGYKYVHKMKNIYHYNCFKKNEFIKNGLDILRSKNCGATFNMKLFPEDVIRAEVLTGGNSDILQGKIFDSEEKPSYAEVFPKTKKTPMKTEIEVRKKPTKDIQQVQQQHHSPCTVTHPRFLSSDRSIDYEARLREQKRERATCDIDDDSPPTLYHCSECDFETIRLNVLILHNKRTHLDSSISTPSPSIKPVKRKLVTVSVNPNFNEVECKENEPTKSEVPKTSCTPSTSIRKRGRSKKVIEQPSSSIVVKENKDSKIISSTPNTKVDENSEPHADPFKSSLLQCSVEVEEKTRGNHKDSEKVESVNKKLNENKDSETIFKSQPVGDSLKVIEKKLKITPPHERIKIERDIRVKVENNIEEAMNVSVAEIVECEEIGLNVRHEKVNTFVLTDESSVKQAETSEQENVNIDEAVEEVASTDSDNEDEERDEDDDSFDDVETIEEVIVHGESSDEISASESTNIEDVEMAETIDENQKTIKKTENVTKVLINSNTETLSARVPKILRADQSSICRSQGNDEILLSSDQLIPSPTTDIFRTRTSSKKVLLNRKVLQSTRKPLSSQIETETSASLLQLAEVNERRSNNRAPNANSSTNQPMEFNYVVDECGNVIAESGSKKEDASILDRALEDPDELQIDIDPNDMIIEKTSGVVGNDDATKIYEGITLTTPAIISI